MKFNGITSFPKQNYVLIALRQVSNARTAVEKLVAPIARYLLRSMTYWSGCYCEIPAETFQEEILNELLMVLSEGWGSVGSCGLGSVLRPSWLRITRPFDNRQFGVGW